MLCHPLPTLSCISSLIKHTHTHRELDLHQALTGLANQQLAPLLEMVSQVVEELNPLVRAFIIFSENHYTYRSTHTLTVNMLEECIALLSCYTQCIMWQPSLVL